MDQATLAKLLNDPLLQFSLGMMGSPSGTTLPQGVARGAGAAYTGMRNSYEDERRRAYLDQQDEYLRLRREDEENQVKGRQSLAGAFNKLPMPTAKDQAEAEFQTALRELAQVDPEKAFALYQSASKSGIIGTPEGPKLPWHAEMLPEGDRPKAARIAAGLEPRAVNPRDPWYMDQLDPDQQDAAAEIAAGMRPRARQPARGRGYDGGSPDDPLRLSKEDQRRRAKIQQARAAVGNLFKGRVDAERYAEQNKGFQKTLDLANERMPGNDPMWDTEQKVRKGVAAKSEAKRYSDGIRKARAANDTELENRYREAAKRRGLKLDI